jgi:DNA polymerase III epsilon subunit-like protein
LANRTVFFDLETGGVKPEHPNIQLAAVAVEGWVEVGTFERKIVFDPSMCEPDALAMNHYDHEVWMREAKPEAIVAEEFARFLEAHRSIKMISKKSGKPYSVARLAGHNAATFDGIRLKNMFGARGMFLPADPRTRDTCMRAQWYFDENGIEPPRDYKLATLCEYFGIDTAGAHDALADVRMCIALAKKIASLSTPNKEAPVGSF